MGSNAWLKVRAEPEWSRHSSAMALFRCTSCATIEQANGTLLSEFATFDNQYGWTTPCPICGGTAVLEGMIRWHDHHLIHIERAGQTICLPASLLGPIAELTSLDDIEA
jgi:hypothetical protein